MDLQELVHGRLRDVLKAAKQVGEGKESEASVHKIRVLIRRLDSLFGLFAGVKEDRKLKKAIKRQNKLRKSLGKVRELDVHRGAWKEWSKGKAYGAAVDREIAGRREKALRRFLEGFDRDRIRKTVRKMEKAVAGRSFSNGKLPDLVERILSPRVGQKDGLHEVRLDIKRLRYSLEELGALRGRDPDGRGDVAFLKELQAELGRINDDEALALFLRKLRRKNAERWSRAVAAGVEKTADDAARRASLERRRWQKLWPQRRRRLKEFA